MRFSALLLAATASALTVDPRVLNRNTISLTTYPTAVCNDGSPGVYYFDAAPAGSTQANVWIVYLQDGGWCWNKQVCDARVSSEVNSVTSTTWGPTYNFALGSILNAGDSTNFGDTNVFWVRYCSSDAHIGDVAASVPFSTVGGTQNNIHFRGRRITQAVFRNLADVHGMSTTTPQTVVLAGSSAGSRGVLHNLNHMRSDYNSYGWTQVSVYGIIDSGLYVVQPTIDWTKSDLDIQAKNIVTYTLADIDPICSAYMVTTYGTTGADPLVVGGTIDPTGQNWRCLMAQFAIDTLQSPHILHQFQMDAWGTYVQLPIPYGWMTKELNNVRPAWKYTMDTYRTLVRESINRPITAAQAAIGATRATHSAACYQHMNLQTASFQNYYGITHSSGQRVTLSNLVDGFIFGAPGIPTHNIENCTGWECGADCDYTRTGAGSPDVCGWWYWFTALRSMTPACQNNLVDYHTAGYFSWPLDDACPCINALDPAVVANHQCPHLFAYGYSPGIPAPSYPSLFPNRPTQQPNPVTGAPLTFAELGVQCATYVATSTSCSSWCNAWTCSLGSCTGCQVCDDLASSFVCESWCNSWTCGFQHCGGCGVCA